MKKLFERSRIHFSTLLSKLKRKPKSEPASPRQGAPQSKGRFDRFTFVSWGVTLVLVLALLVPTMLYKSANGTPGVSAPLATLESGTGQPLPEAPAIGANG